MPWFQYEGQCPGGTAISGRIEAADHAEATSRLEQMQVTLIQIEPVATEPPPRRPISRDDFVYFNQQLASLAQAGMALDDGLREMARDVQSPRLRAMVTEIADAVASGTSLEDAIAARESQFPMLYARVIRAGVTSGDLATTLINLNTHLRLMGQTRRMIWEAATYPLMVLVLAIGVMGLVSQMIVPTFEEIFAGFEAELPGPTLLLFKLQHAYWPVAIGLVGTVVLIVLLNGALRVSASGRRRRESLLLCVPLVRTIYSTSLLSRFSQAAALCVASGVPLPEALRLAADATGSPVLAADADRISVAIEQGDSPVAVTQSTGLIPRLFGYSVQVASERGVLPEMLHQLATGFGQRAENANALARSWLPPLLVIIVGGMIGMCILGLFLPLVTLINSVST